MLAHSTNSPWWRSYTPPKGGMEGTETPAEAASREVEEEVGVKIPAEQLKEVVDVEYRNPKGSLYKIVHMFVHRIDDYSEIGVPEDGHIPFSNLQREEIDEARFLNREEVEKKVLPRYLDYILKVIDDDTRWNGKEIVIPEKSIIGLKHDEVSEEDFEPISSFGKIVKNYKRMQRLNEKEDANN